MVSANLNELELHTGTVEGNPDVEAHFAFPLFWATGNASTAVLCVELEPGKSGPRHIDMPEEILLVEQGEVEIEVGDERAVFGPGGVVLVPALVPHAFATWERGGRGSSDSSRATRACDCRRCRAANR
jgi:quercetin dioxygenase-like cupin family protein